MDNSHLTAIIQEYNINIDFVRVRLWEREVHGSRLCLIAWHCISGTELLGSATSGSVTFTKYTWLYYSTTKTHYRFKEEQMGMRRILLY
jgi:hypothetical protein